MNYIGENFRRIREQQGMSIEKVARMLDVKVELIERWEAGKEIPDADNLALAARLFGISENELRGKTDEGGGSGSDNSSASTQEPSDKTTRFDTAEDMGAPGKGASDGAQSSFNARASSSGRRQNFNEAPLLRYLAADEKLLWSGQPTDEHISVFGGFQSVFGLFFVGFAVFWMVMVTRIAAFMSIFALPFIMIGMYIVAGKSIILNNNKKNIYYAVTNQRVMMMISGRYNRFRDIRYSRISEVKLVLSRRQTGCGTIIFTSPNLIPEYPYGRYWDRRSNNNSLLDSFIDIADAERVYNLINKSRAL